VKKQLGYTLHTLSVYRCCLLTGR